MELLALILIMVLTAYLSAELAIICVWFVDGLAHPKIAWIAIAFDVIAIGMLLNITKVWFSHV